MTKSKLIGKKVRVISENENYNSFRDKVLVITHAANSGNGYDDCVYPQYLCDFKEANTGLDIPFALYEYEFELV